MAAKKRPAAKKSPAGAPAANHALLLRDDLDDAARLVLADDLQQRGDPLGELIVVQCELARLPNVASQRRIHLQLRAESLVERNRKRWLAHLPLTDREKTTVTFWRGFPSGVSLGVERFVRIGEELFEKSSFDTLTLSQLGPLRRVKPELLSRVVTLRLQSNGSSIDPAALRAMFASDAPCERFRALDLSGAPSFEHQTLAVIGDAPGTRALTALNLKSTFARDVDIERLCKSNALPNLASLDIGGNRLTLVAADAIAKSAWPLRELSCGFGLPQRHSGGYWDDGQMMSEGLARLAQSGKLAPLESLVFESQQVDDAGLRALAKVSFERLERLSLAGNLFTAGSIAALLESSVTANLTSLDLSLHPLNFAVETLVRARLPKLVTLKLGAASLHDAELVRLCEASWMSQLVELDLSNNVLTDVGVDALAEAVPKMVSLNLRGNDLSARGTHKLREQETMLVLET